MADYPRMATVDARVLQALHEVAVTVLDYLNGDTDAESLEGALARLAVAEEQAK